MSCALKYCGQCFWWIILFLFLLFRLKFAWNDLFLAVSKKPSVCFLQMFRLRATTFFPIQPFSVYGSPAEIDALANYNWHFNWSIEQSFQSFFQTLHLLKTYLINQYCLLHTIKLRYTSFQWNVSLVDRELLSTAHSAQIKLTVKSASLYKK